MPVLGTRIRDVLPLTAACGFPQLGKAKGRLSMRTITAYGIAAIIVLAILNGIAWLAGNPRVHGLNVFSAGFALGMLGMYLSAWLYGYRKAPVG
ncbi:MAG: hypothetical protein JO047_03900 [Alphaproteobacteria bacterium]|nr:hypothetical protein [Alphaproteobacteria bacterium]